MGPRDAMQYQKALKVRLKINLPSEYNNTLVKNTQYIYCPRILLRFRNITVLCSYLYVANRRTIVSFSCALARNKHYFMMYLMDFFFSANTRMKFILFYNSTVWIVRLLLVFALFPPHKCQVSWIGRKISDHINPGPRRNVTDMGPMLWKSCERGSKAHLRPSRVLGLRKPLFLHLIVFPTLFMMLTTV